MCKLVSIFMHEDRQGCQQIACCIQRYLPLSSLSGSSPVLAKAQRNSVGEREVVLDSKQLLLKSSALNWLKKSCLIVEAEDEFKNSQSAYLCRFAQEDAVVRELRFCVFICLCVDISCFGHV